MHAFFFQYSSYFSAQRRRETVEPNPVSRKDGKRKWMDIYLKIVNYHSIYNGVVFTKKLKKNKGDIKESRNQKDILQDIQLSLYNGTENMPKTNKAKEQIRNSMTQYVKSHPLQRAGTFGLSQHYTDMHTHTHIHTYIHTYTKCKGFESMSNAVASLNN